MELFYSENCGAECCVLDKEEMTHCVKVLRHRLGDPISVIDGKGGLYRCTLSEISSKEALAKVDEVLPGWGGHDYRLTMAVCPTKNNDRYEWFAEKAVETGVDCIVPVIGEHSERKVFKTDRLQRIVVSAAKQSLKAALPRLSEPVSVMDFIKGCPADSLKLIAYCFEGDLKRTSIKEALQGYGGKDVVILIGPEGDFSREEAAAAIAGGFIPVHLGASRLRTETAALIATSAVYFKYM